MQRCYEMLAPFPEEAQLRIWQWVGSRLREANKAWWGKLGQTGPVGPSGPSTEPDGSHVTHTCDPGPLGEPAQ